MQKRFDVVFNNTQDWRRPAEEFGAVRSTQTDKPPSDKNEHLLSIAPQNGLSQIFSEILLKVQCHSTKKKSKR